MCALAVRGLVCHDLAATPPDLLLLLREEDPMTVSLLVGHARASMSLDVYGHVLVDGRWDAAGRQAAPAQRLPRVTSRRSSA
jgi:hypothetical protein